MKNEIHRIGGVRCGIFGFYMGALRWDGRDARLHIENRFRILARLYGFTPDEPEHEVNLARSSTCG